jgi:glycosyltransferase involved in cell wall biosynthesis
LDEANGAAICDAVRELLADRPLYERLSRGAVEFAAGHFSWQKSAGQILEFYRSLIGSETVRRAA